MLRSRFAWSLLGLVWLIPFACNVDNDPDGTEDKTGVNDIPPGQSTGAGTGGEGGVGLPCADATDCDDEDDCTADSCVNLMCRNTSIADDGNACTYDLCSQGTVTNPPGFVLFSDQFTDNMQMWALTGQWQIGPAAASAGALDGGDDPATDHSASDDNGVAGTVIGDLVAPTGGTSEYLTSPAIVLTGSDPNTDFYTLRFWRWLNADAAPVMTTNVEVSDTATTFVEVWSSTSKIIDAPPRGVGWFEVRIDITSAVRDAVGAGVDPVIRFGFVKNGSAQSVGGWSIDDVTVEATRAPVDDLLCTLDTCTDVDGAAVPVATPMPAIDDGIACSTFVCDAGSFDNPQQQENMPDCFMGAGGGGGGP